MSFEVEKRSALALLTGLEEGSIGESELSSMAQKAEPVLLHFIFTWLRKKYRADHPAAGGVIGRLVDLCSNYPTIADMAKEGESDSMVEWFEDAYSYRDYTAEEFIDLVVDKLES